MRTIKHGDEYMKLHDNGCIERSVFGPSQNWRVVGAVERNNFGAVVKRYTLQEILDNGNNIPWQFKNGQQRTFIQDFDHGSFREWRSPNHRVL